ncbi:hypothetical protein TCAL_08210 [Tigriopus californicus]|uniref:C2H2-type domain-containing protein n=1 Tax=Tigriopus californicus TaxID=6832 RepID=A0A553NDY3_TIGCA|nr:uncharacterized protein LOC131888153 [Tigriopus californicus]XP_059092921.1 uncharacterized protein LOC131888153 [Tigriopus californicus]TRY63618.1 hypothetical protein TCAL_08210 [Tigriopus californicus]
MEDSASTGAADWNSEDEIANLPSPIDMSDLMQGNIAQVEIDSDECDVETAIKLETPSDEFPTNECIIPGCHRLYVTNINEDEPMIRLPPKRNQHTKDIAEYLCLRVDGRLWHMDDEYFICAKHFANGVCCRIRGHPSYLPSIFPPGFEPKWKKPAWKLNPKFVTSENDFIEPIAHDVIKDEITFELLSDSEIDEPYAAETTVRIPPNRNEKVDAQNMDQWSQLPTCGDILRSVFALLTSQEKTPPKAIALNVHAIWERTHCCPISLLAIAQRIRDLTQSASGLRSSDILGSRKREFAKLFDVLAPVSERDDLFNAEFYADQMTNRKMFMAPNGAVLKPAAPPGQMKKAQPPLKEVGLPTWLQLPTIKQVHETLTTTPFSTRTLAKILRSLWKKADCQPCNLNYVCDKLLELKTSARPSQDLFDIAWESSLRNKSVFNDAFYEDQKGPRKMFLIPLDLSKLAPPPPTSTPMISNKRPCVALSNDTQIIPAKKKRGEQSQRNRKRAYNRDPRVDLMNQLGYPDLSNGILLRLAENFETDQKMRQFGSLPNLKPLLNRKCGFSKPPKLRSDLPVVADFVVKCRGSGLVDSPLYQEATNIVHSQIEQIRTQHMKENVVIKTSNSSSEKSKSEVMSQFSEKQWHAKEVSLLRQQLRAVQSELNMCHTILADSDGLSVTKFPVQFISAQVAQLSERNRRYREIIDLYRGSFKLGHNKNRTIAVLNQRLKLCEDTLKAYMLKPTLMERMLIVQEEINMASSVQECKHRFNGLMKCLVNHEYLSSLQTNLDAPWHEEDRLIDLIEDDLLDDYQGAEFAPGEFFDPSMLVYKCANCGLGHDSANKLLQHEKFFCSFTTESVCYVCHMRVPQAEMDCHIEEHAKVYRIDVSMSCDICSKIMPNLKELSNHAKLHNIHFRYCICCKRTFKNEELFANHWWKRFEYKNATRREPPNKKPQFLCSYCGLTFRIPAHADPNALHDYHICKFMEKSLSQTGAPKAHLCTDCGAGFFGLVEFKKHLYETQHTVPDGISIKTNFGNCVICDRNCPSKKKMDEHILIHTTIMPYQCPICGHKSHKNYTLRRHVLDTHQDANFKTKDAITIPEEVAKKEYLLADIPGRIHEFLDQEAKPKKKVGTAAQKARQKKSKAIANLAASRSNLPQHPLPPTGSVVVPVVQAQPNTHNMKNLTHIHAITEMEEQKMATTHLQNVLNTNW